MRTANTKGAQPHLQKMAAFSCPQSPPPPECGTGSRAPPAAGGRGGSQEKVKLNYLLGYSGGTNAIYCYYCTA
jgi:hypothetical protein